jgi:hypothetical protein
MPVYSLTSTNLYAIRAYISLLMPVYSLTSTNLYAIRAYISQLVDVRLYTLGFLTTHNVPLYINKIQAVLLLLKRN